MAKIRVVLADDHISIMVNIREVLGEQFEVLGSFVNGRQAVDATLRMDPDAVVLDISMPVLNGIQAARQLQAANCRAKISSSACMTIRTLWRQRSRPGRVGT